MSVGQQIHELIRSMSPSEKGYFKKYSARHIIGEGNDYMTLFEAIDSLESYSDDALMKKNSIKTMAQRLPGIKNYLYKQIMESLRSYHSGKNQAQVIQDALYDVRLLSERGLYTHAEKIVKKAVEMAREIEHNRLYLDALTYYLLVISHFVSDKHYGELSESIINELESASEKVYNEYLYWIYNLRIEDSLVAQGITTHAKEQYSADILSHPLMSTVQPLSFTAWLSSMFIQTSHYQYIEKDQEKSREISEIIVKKFEENPIRKEQYFGLYIGTLTTMLSYYCLHKHYELYENNIYLLRDSMQQKNLNAYQKARAAMLFLRTEITYDMVSENMGRFAENIPEYTKLYQTYQHFFPPIYQKLLTMECGAMCLVSGNPRLALEWFQRTLSSDAHIRSDAHRSAELLSLCAHLDTGGEAYLDYGIRSFTRSKSKFLPVTEFHRHFLKLLRHIAEAHSPHARHSLVSGFIEQHSNNTEADPFLLSVLHLWKPKFVQKKQQKKNPYL